MLISFLLHLLPSGGPWWLSIGNGLTGTSLGFLVTALFLKVEKKSFRDVGLVWTRGTLARFFTGVVIAGIIFTLMLGALLVFTALQITRRGYAVDYVGAFLIFLPLVPLAWMEELAFRGYTFRRLDEGLSLWPAQVITAVAFAVYHVLGDWTWTGAFVGPFVWSFVFGLAAFYTRGIAMPLGIHLTLNIAQRLTGMNKTDASLWELSYPPEATQTLITHTDDVGLGLHILVFAIAVIVTVVTQNSRLKLN